VRVVCDTTDEDLIEINFYLIVIIYYTILFNENPKSEAALFLTTVCIDLLEAESNYQTIIRLAFTYLRDSVDTIKFIAKVFNYSSANCLFREQAARYSLLLSHLSFVKKEKKKRKRGKRRKRVVGV
jgi:hypothetical protein